MNEKQIDHLFRHQFGKMVSILTRIFGFEHLETIEDAVQDTFIQALRAWKTNFPDNPEAWLTAAAKNRVIDIFRSVNAARTRHEQIHASIKFNAHVDELFLEHQIEDSQLRMIFTACHPSLDQRDQIAFALRALSGFSTKEIAAALLSQSETIKKRLQRMRKRIIEEGIQMEVPEDRQELTTRLERVMEVIYIIFNEGFHSNKQDMIIRKDLCGEAIRLCKLLLSKPKFQSGKLYALFALMCFHVSRLDSKINSENELIPLAEQDRSSWYYPLMAVGNDAMIKAVEADEYSSYHFEAAIAAEHLRAPTFEATNWAIIAQHYENLVALQPNPFTKLNLAIAYLQQQDLPLTYTTLLEIEGKDLAQKEYLYHATMAEYYHKVDDPQNALISIDQALTMTQSQSETRFLSGKREVYRAG